MAGLFYARTRDIYDNVSLLADFVMICLVICRLYNPRPFCGGGGTFVKGILRRRYICHCTKLHLSYFSNTLSEFTAKTLVIKRIANCLSMWYD